MTTALNDKYCALCRCHYSDEEAHNRHHTFPVEEAIKEERSLQDTLADLKENSETIVKLANAPKAEKLTQQQDSIFFAYEEDYEEILDEVKKLSIRLETKLTLRYHDHIRIASWNLHNNDKDTSSMCCPITNYHFDRKKW